jgi:type IV fimbrial biogenesis protein FimT
MRTMARMSGVTIVELLVALAVAGVLLGLALPNFRDFAERSRSAAVLNQLIGAVQTARHAAITLRTAVTLCPGTAIGCGPRDSWHDGALVFADRNANGRIDGGEEILRSFPPLPAGTRVYWRSFRNRSYLQINATGLTNWQNGHLLYCPANRNVHFARAVIINAQGRVRSAPDTNRDNIAEDANGDPLVCP